MKAYQGDITIARPADVVFDFFADLTRLPVWAPEDFVSVTRLDGEPVRQGTRFAYVTKGARAESTFAWEIFDRPSVLVFSGPRIFIPGGWVEGLGRFIFTITPAGTVVNAYFKPTLGGILRIVSPVARLRNVRVLANQLVRAKALIEST